MIEPDDRGNRPVIESAEFRSKGGQLNRYRWLVVVVVALSMIVVSSSSSSGTTTTASKGGSAQCKSVPLKATEVGVTPSDISIQVMADVGSPLAPGLFQANVDAINGFAKYWNALGGIGCRQVKVNVWDSKLSAEESKNGLINGCQNSLAKVGGSTLFNADVSPMTGSVDKSGAATGLPDLAGVANSLTEQCAKGVYVIHSVNEVCPVVLGRPRPFREPGGTTKWYVKNLFKGVKPHGLYMVPGDLPSTTASSMPIIESQRQAGFTFDDLLKVSSRDTQAAFTPRVQSVKDHASNFVFGGTNDTGLILMRKEAKAQGVDTVKLWACSLGCYTKAFVASGGTAVDGTYLWLGFLPFEEVKANKEMQHYVTTVGTDKINSFGGEA